MSVFQNFLGTSETRFRIGLTGPTIYTGTADPTVTPPTPIADGLKDGDIYIRTLSGSEGIWLINSGGFVEVPTGATGGSFSGDISMNPGAQLLGDGTASAGAPAFAFTGDEDTGIFRSAVNAISISTNGLERFVIESDGTLASTTASYETLVLSDNDVPNKKYVDDSFVNISGDTMTGDLLFGAGIQLLLDDGTVTDPALAFISDPDTGLYHTGTSGIFSVASNGSQTFVFSPDGLQAIGSQFIGTNGGTAAPDYSFDSDLTTGIFGGIPGEIAFASAGVETFRFTSTTISSDLTWVGGDGDSTTPAFRFAVDTDTGLYRISDNTGGLGAFGNEVLRWLSASASDVNNISVASAQTTLAPTISAIGSDANIDLAINAKGTGNIVISGLTYPNTDGLFSQVLTTDGAGTLFFQTSGGGGASTGSNSYDAVNTWTARPAPDTNNWQAVTWSPELNLFVSISLDVEVGNPFGQVMTSPDGLVWTLRDVPEVNEWRDVAWSPELKLFAAVAQTGTSRVMTSPDGINWTSRTAAEANLWQAIIWSPKLNLFAAVSLDGTNRVMTSPDGITWTARVAAEANPWIDIVWAAEPGLFVAVAESGTNQVMTSLDGITWTPQVAAEANTWKSVTWSPEIGIFVAVSEDGTNRSMISSDGFNWFPQDMVAPNAWQSVTWSPELSKFAAVSSSGGNRVATSSTGTSWITHLAAENNGWNNITWSSKLGRFAAVSSSGSNRIMVSQEYDGYPQYRKISDDKANEPTAETITEVSVETWNTRLSPEINQWYAVAWSPELKLFAAVASTGTDRVMTSFDGITWSPQTAAEANSWRAITWSPELGLFAAVSTDGTNRVMTSPDGITWSPQTAAEANAWSGIAWSSELGLFAAVSTDGTNRVMTSPDGITWTARVAAEANSWQSITWAPELGIFAAASFSGTNRIMTSRNGITWEAQPATEITSWQAIAWSPELNLFAVVSNDSSNRVMTSSDGSTWILRDATEANAWRNITWAAELGVFVAISSNGTNRIMASSDGIEWTAYSAAEANAWFGISWSPELGIFAATAIDGTNQVMTSNFYDPKQQYLSIYDRGVTQEVEGDIDFSGAITIGGSGIQAQGDVLDDLIPIGSPTADGQFIVATGAGAFAYESNETARASLQMANDPAVTSEIGLAPSAVFTGDLDTLVGGGGVRAIWHRVDTGATNTPPGANVNGSHVFTRTFDSSAARQIYLEHSTNNIYTRNSDLGVWDAWTELATDVTAFAKTLLDDASAAAARGTLEMADGTTTNAEVSLAPSGNYGGDLDAIAGTGRRAIWNRVTTGATNTPSGATVNGSHVFTRTWNLGAARQLYLEHASNNIYTRMKNSGVWSSWTPVAVSGSTLPLDFGSAASFEIPNSATPTVDAAGEIAVDTTITDHTGLIKYHDGVEELTVIAVPTGNLTTTDSQVLAYNATNDEFEFITSAAGVTELNDLTDVTITTPALNQVVAYNGTVFVNQYQGMELIETADLTNGGANNLTGFELSHLMVSGYIYILHVRSLSSTDASWNSLVRFKNVGGTIRNASGDYRQGSGITNSTGTTNGESLSAVIPYRVAQDASSARTFTVQIFSAMDSSKKTHGISDGMVVNGTSNARSFDSWHVDIAAEAHDRIIVAVGVGTMDSGEAFLYRIKEPS